MRNLTGYCRVGHKVYPKCDYKKGIGSGRCLCTFPGACVDKETEVEHYARLGIEVEEGS